MDKTTWFRRAQQAVGDPWISVGIDGVRDMRQPATPTPREKPTDAQRERLARALAKVRGIEWVDLPETSFTELDQNDLRMQADALLAAGYLHRDDAATIAIAESLDSWANGGNADVRAAYHLLGTKIAAALRQKEMTDGD